MAGVSIVSYLRYLHDVNRKLLQHGGLESVLYRKPASKNPCYLQLDHPDPARPRHLLATLRHIENAEAKGSFWRPLVGFGLIVGQLDTPKGIRRLSAPLAFCGASLAEEEDRPSSVQMIPQWDSITLNYDLLAFFLKQEADEEDTNGSLLPKVGLDANTLRVFTEAEEELERHASSANPDHRLTHDALSQTMKYIRDGVPELRSIAVRGDPYDHRRLDKELAELTPPVFFAHRFFFLAPSAGELTTMSGLATLIRKTEKPKPNGL